ncbi:MAG: hypothetical protein A4E60_03111 [Syntrophorhabdus sp. PtaB.Bin047]|nr:MAG: hypothetical protein A4E60_03111 [Syntrophorhabdus sp. PtaB.Bin047]
MRVLERGEVLLAVVLPVTRRKEDFYAGIDLLHLAVDLAARSFRHDDIEEHHVYFTLSLPEDLQRLVAVLREEDFIAQFL